MKLKRVVDVNNKWPCITEVLLTATWAITTLDTKNPIYIPWKGGGGLDLGDKKPDVKGLG
jgi:hypothetical protein